MKDDLLNWGEVADLFDKYSGSSVPARCLPMDEVVYWLEKHPELAYKGKDRCFHRLKGGRK